MSSKLSSQNLFECVPNVSEGRDREKIDRLALSIVNGGSKLLHVDSNVDANRTVFTFVGSKQEVLSSAKELLNQVSKEIDISEHSGVHPYVGALDVCPFVPLRNCKMTDAVELSKEFAKFASDSFDLASLFI